MTGTQTAETGKNRDSDLETALKQAILPALAGMAVGQMLSNDREVALNTGDRVVVTRADGSQEIIKDDNALLLRPGSTVQTEEYADGSSRTIVTREDGSQVITIRDADLRILRDPFSAKPHVLFYATKRVGGGLTDPRAVKFLVFG